LPENINKKIYVISNISSEGQPGALCVHMPDVQ